MGVPVQLSWIRFRGRRAAARTPLAFLLVIGFLIGGCQSNPLSVGGHPAGEDCVHRIVESGQLRVGMSGLQPPLNMKTRAGELVGLDVDLARALAEAMNVELVLVERPFSELLEGLAASDFDLIISSLTITPARNAQFAFAGPYMVSGATLLTRKALIDELGNLEALDSPDRTWAALEGSTGEALIRDAFPNAKLVTTGDLPAIVSQIQSGKIDGVIADLPYVRFELARRPDAGLAVLPTPFTTEPLGVALPPNSPLFANLVQNYLNTLEYTGRLIQMKARWLNGGDWLSEIP